MSVISTEITLRNAVDVANVKLGNIKDSNLKFSDKPHEQNKQADNITPVNFDNILWEGDYLTACSIILRQPQIN